MKCLAIRELADIFRKRTINVTPEITHVESPREALLASLGTRAKTRLGRSWRASPARAR